MTTLQIEHTLVDADGRTLDDKLVCLNEILRGLGRVLIGYSGGVDSALLVVAAHRVLGEDAIAVTADSESYAEGELEMAVDIVRRFGVRHQVVHTRELDNPDYASNPTNRCYFCKTELFVHMEALAAELRIDNMLYGHNIDDVGDFRPGATAAREHGVRAPLKEAGFTKADVRELARRWEIPVWNRPAMACLSSRFPYGTPVTSEGLRRVDRAETAVRAEGFGSHVRVRHHGDVARIELPAEDLERLLADADLRARLAAALTELGYERVTADLRGFRSGSLNEVLKKGSDEPERAAHESVLDAATRLGVGTAETGAARQITWIRLPGASTARLTDEALRTRLVAAAEAAGALYVALDLTPLA
ncbi:MAG: ATP-dependent sacrificial sulfur transferase LarE [bacterium]|nr:ATP-dependent sacrificial sulfur transferase LarE [bacterium]